MYCLSLVVVLSNYFYFVLDLRMLQCLPIKLEDLEEKPLKLIKPTAEDYQNSIVRGSPLFVRFVCF